MKHTHTHTHNVADAHGSNCNQMHVQYPVELPPLISTRNVWPQNWCAISRKLPPRMRYGAKLVCFHNYREIFRSILNAHVCFVRIVFKLSWKQHGTIGTIKPIIFHRINGFRSIDEIQLCTSLHKNSKRWLLISTKKKEKKNNIDTEDEECDEVSGVVWCDELNWKSQQSIITQAIPNSKQVFGCS